MIIDIRSDTVTRPSPEMRRFMAEAEVGDDVFREDPTINMLEEETAALVGTEAAIYVPSGTMGNQIGVWVNTHEGAEVILERDCHILNYEAGAAAVLSRVLVRPIQGTRGVMTAAQIESEIHPDTNLHFAPTRLVCVENTANKAGGTVWPYDEFVRISALCGKYGLRLHLDGARLWNAAAASGIAEKEWVKNVDTVSVCFSKGLGAPVGSALCGTKETINLARKKRKILGGGMRQAGVIAAGALYALRNNRARLVEDHENAKRIANAVGNMPGFRVDLAGVQSNIVMIEITAPGVTGADVSKRMNEEGVLINPIQPQVLRAVTHLDAPRAAIDCAIDAFARVAKTFKT